MIKKGLALQKHSFLWHDRSSTTNPRICLISTEGYPKLMSDSSPKNARAVAYRALCIGALLKRHELELRVKTLRDYIISEDDRKILIEERRAMNENLLDWVVEEGLSPHLTFAENRLLYAPLGEWSSRWLMHTSWRAETLGMLLWSLRVLDDIPPYDVPFEQEDILAPLDIFTPTIDFVWCAELRPTSSLRAMRDLAELWDWRARATQLQRLGVRPMPNMSLSDIIRATAEQAHRNGTLNALINGDFPAFGKPYALLSDDQYDLTRTIAYERYSAMNWVSESSTSWVSLPID